MRSLSTRGYTNPKKNQLSRKKNRALATIQREYLGILFRCHYLFSRTFFVTTLLFVSLRAKSRDCDSQTHVEAVFFVPPHIALMKKTMTRRNPPSDGVVDIIIILYTSFSRAFFLINPHPSIASGKETIIPMIQQLLQLQRPKKAVGVLFCFCVLLVSATFPISWLLKKKQPQQQQQQQQANNGAERTRINPNSSNNSSSRNSRSNSWTVLHRNKNTKNTINNTINNSTIHQLMESTSHRNVTIQNQIYSSPKQTKMNKKTPHQGHHPRYINPIRQITILGERNSGTRWTFEYVSPCIVGFAKRQLQNF